jgi:hypothetical protein
MTVSLPRRISSHLSACTLTLVTLATPAARADAPAMASAPSTEQCVEANDAAQSLRRDGKFDDARSKLMLCVQTSCPGLVRSDCARRLDELDKAEPGLVFDVKDEAGNDLIDVTITVDGRRLTEKLTGTALQIDPGAHDFTFEAAGRSAVSRQLLLREGERARHELVVLRAPEGAPVLPHSPAGHTQRDLGFVAGGVGLGGLAVGALFGLLASSAKSAQEQDCASSNACSNRAQAIHEHDTLETDASVSTVAFLGGGALLATGIVLIVTGTHGTGEARSAWTVAPGVDTRGAGLTMHGEF